MYPVGLNEPISLVGGVGGESADGWYRLKTVWVSDATYEGPVLVRGAGLDGVSPVRFELDRNADTELRLPLSGSATTAGQDVGWRNWPSYTMVQGFGCYALQIDGDRFSRVVTFEVVP